jgi:hypothetical protein
MKMTGLSSVKPQSIGADTSSPPSYGCLVSTTIAAALFRRKAKEMLSNLVLGNPASLANSAHIWNIAK